MNEIAIVPYEEKYRAPLVEVWHRAVLATHHFLTEEHVAFYRDMVEKEALGSVDTWVALDESGEPLGFIGAAGTSIEMLFVDPSSHGRGIGRRLFNYVKQLRGDPLSVDVNEQNEGARAFYERLGFVPAGRSETDGSGNPYPILHLVEREGHATATDESRSAAGWRFDNSYARLPEVFYTRLDPTPVGAPELAVLNGPLAAELGLNADALSGKEGVDVFAGNRLPEGAEPLAQAYAGHQFGHFNRLGDGRAILLGEQIAPSGARFDVQLKGSGPTPYSRSGDGRAALGPMLREYIVSEAMHALGIPTTRSLAVVTTGEKTYRETPLPGAILTRIAASHLRVGTFQYAAQWGTEEELRKLAEYTLIRHYPEALEEKNRYIALLQEVISSQADLIAKWQLVGFIHGVMNTDNMALSGETIDYGPCAFMDAYDPATVFSSIDGQGRYAYGNQPYIAAWNLARFAETLLPFFHEDEAEAVRIAEEELSGFARLYHWKWLNGMRAKLGLFNEEPEDEALANDLLSLLQKHGADYTNAFVALAYGEPAEPRLEAASDYAEWRSRWEARLTRQFETPDEAKALMRSRNPVVIPRNHRVEEALDAAVREGDYKPLERLLAALAAPYADGPEKSGYKAPPEPSGLPYRTFCGT